MKRAIFWLGFAILMSALACGSKSEKAAEQNAHEGVGSGGTGSSTASGMLPSYGRATVTGRVRVTGAVPAPELLEMSADPYCEEAHEGEKVYSEEVVADAEGNLANAFVYVSEGLEGRHYEAPSQAAVLNQEGCMYRPHVLGMMVTQPLDLVSSDPTLHNIHALPKAQGNKEFNLGMSRPGVRITKTFTKPEIMVTMKCDVHPWMSAYIGVVENPFFAVTDEDGRFEIPRLPAGSYTLNVWHEVFGTQSRRITLDEAGTFEVDYTFEAASP